MREKLRAWQEKSETFALEVILGQRRDKKATFFRAGLYVLSKVFHIGVKGRRMLYAKGVLRGSTLGVQVITVGNLTVGGTGKTPVVEKFARVLQDQGRKVAILSRGYRSNPSRSGGPLRIVSDAKNLLLNSDEAGDEPYMLASNLKDVVVLVDKDRVKTGQYAIKKFDCDTLLLDDGFQYRKLAGRRRANVELMTTVLDKDRFVVYDAKGQVDPIGWNILHESVEIYTHALERDLKIHKYDIQRSYVLTNVAESKAFVAVVDSGIVSDRATGGASQYLANNLWMFEKKKEVWLATTLIYNVGDTNAGRFDGPTDGGFVLQAPVKVESRQWAQGRDGQ